MSKYVKCLLHGLFSCLILVPLVAHARYNAQFSVPSEVQSLGSVFDLPVNFTLSDSSPMSVGCGKQNATFTLAFDKTKLQAIAINNADYGVIDPKTVDNVNGIASAKAIAYQGYPACTNLEMSGVLATVTFRVVALGGFDFSLPIQENSYFYYQTDSSGYSTRVDLSVTTSAGHFSNPEPSPTPTPRYTPTTNPMPDTPTPTPAAVITATPTPKPTILPSTTKVASTPASTPSISPTITPSSTTDLLVNNIAPTSSPSPSQSSDPTSSQSSFVKRLVIGSVILLSFSGISALFYLNRVKILTFFNRLYGK